MADHNGLNIDVWILKELRLLGIPLPKLKKIRMLIHKKNQKGKASGTFGVCLSKLLEHDSLNQSTVVIPLFLEKMVNYLSKHVTRNCIFRKNGNKDRMSQLQERLEKGIELTNEHVEDTAGVLKSWFRDLPVALIPEDFHDLFITCHKTCETSSSSKALLLACSLLPPEHLATLKYTLEFLSTVAKHSAVNKMSSQSLAIVFAPNVMPIMSKRKLDKSISIDVLKERQGIAMSVVQWLIEHSEEVKQTPQSVEFLAQLSTQSSGKNNRTEQQKKTKRRKSMCDIVGVKIKKMVAPHSDVIRPIRSKESILKHKADCKSPHHLPIKRTKKNVETSAFQTLLISNEKPCLTDCGKDDHIISNKNESVQPDELDQPKETAKFSSPSLTSTENTTQSVTDRFSAETCLQGNPVHPSEHGNVEYTQNMKTIITVNPSPVNKTTPLSTPSKEENGKVERPRSTLRRGKPNSVTSGLKDRRKGNLRYSTSLDNLVVPFEALQVSRRSKSTSSIDGKWYEQDSQLSPSIIRNTNISSLNEDLNDFFSKDISQEDESKNMLNNSISPTAVNRMLDFFNLDDHLSVDSCGQAADSSPVGASLGFSPILSSDQELESGNENKGHDTWSTVPSNTSRNPFEDITNTSEIPTLNSSLGDNSIFDTVDKSAGESLFQVPKQRSILTDNFATPSPIASRVCPKSHSKLSITASSTPANNCNKVMWQDAATFGFDKSEDDADGPKRESIIKLKERNAGKVLANINLYNNKSNQNAMRFSRSPAFSQNIALERNCFATKSVRERINPFSDGHGFKVPSTCPSSIKRVSQKAKITLSCPISKPAFVSNPFLDTVDETKSRSLNQPDQKKV